MYYHSNGPNGGQMAGTHWHPIEYDVPKPNLADLQVAWFSGGPVFSFVATCIQPQNQYYLLQVNDFKSYYIQRNQTYL